MMDNIVERIEKLKPHPTEAITLFYNFDDVDAESIRDIVELLSKKFTTNTVVALPDNVSLESCSKDVLENIISMITVIIEQL